MSGYDLIELKGITRRGTHGVYDHERVEGQTFVADVTLYCELEQAGHSDSLADTTNYAEVAQMVEKILAGSPSNLIEAVAIHIADRVLEFPKVAGVKVTVHKPQAPVGVEISDVCVTLWRGVADKDAPTPETDPTSMSVNSKTPVSGETAAQFAVAAASAEADTPALAEQTPATEPTGAPVESRRSRRALADGSEADAELLLDTPLGQPRHVVLALGSNQGNSLEILREVVRTLREFPELTEVKSSVLMRTAPVLMENQQSQDDYYNTVITGYWSGSPRELLEVCRSLEEEHGRHRTGTWSPRTLDVDIIDIEGVTLNTPELTVPHPRAHERAFVLLPWGMLEPTAKLVDEEVLVLAEYAQDRAGIKRIWENWVDKNTKLPSGLPQPTETSGEAPLPQWSVALEPPAVRIVDDPEALVPVGADDHISEAGLAAGSEATVTEQQSEVKTVDAGVVEADSATTESVAADSGLVDQDAAEVSQAEANAAEVDEDSEKSAWKEVPDFLRTGALEQIDPNQVEETKAPQAESAADEVVEPDGQWLPTVSIEQVQAAEAAAAAQPEQPEPNEHPEQKTGAWKRFVNWLTGEDELDKNKTDQNPAPDGTVQDDSAVEAEEETHDYPVWEPPVEESSADKVEENPAEKPASEPVKAPQRKSLLNRTPVADPDEAEDSQPHFLSFNDFNSGHNTLVQEPVSDSTPEVVQPIALKGDEIDAEELARISRRAMHTASQGIDREKILRPTTTGSIPIIRRKPEAE